MRVISHCILCMKNDVFLCNIMVKMQDYLCFQKNLCLQCNLNVIYYIHEY